MKFGNETQVLNNSKIILRRFRESDLDQLTRITYDPEVMEFIGGIMSLDETKLYLSKLIHLNSSMNMYAVINKHTMEFAGLAGYVNSTDSYPEIHVAIIKSFQRKGLAKEAFALCLDFATDVLYKTSVSAYIKTGNNVAKKVLRKMEFKFKKTEFICGKSREMYVYSPSYLMN